MRRWLIFAVVLAACGSPVEPIDNAERFDPPSIYAEWWAEVEECSGLVGDFQRIRWWLDSDLYEETGWAAVWYAPHNIYLDRASAMLDNEEQVEPAVKHEMLHDLTQEAGHDHEHPAFACA